MNPERREQHSSAKASSSLGRPPPRFSEKSSPEQVSQYAREYWKWLDEDSKIPPHPATPVDRKHLIRQCEDHRVQLESLARQIAGDVTGKKRWYTTMVGFPKHSSSTPLQDLTRSTHPLSLYPTPAINPISVDFSKMYVRKAHAVCHPHRYFRPIIDQVIVLRDGIFYAVLSPPAVSFRVSCASCAPC